MSSLSFPDINVWLALATPEHVHTAIARRWWEKETGAIGFCRLTQLGFLRLMTTAAVMDGSPLTIAAAWRVHDRFYEDDRVAFISEPPEVEKKFREKAVGRIVSQKVWADAWLLAFAQAAGGVLVTFDKALGPRGAHCLIPTRS
ncbi:MAG TPA: TA system VapC family ribonuclease toxin [Terracidiphilus sp.]|jgi:toxin-antitoxin system PIN domain toxin|nr:TA system VapC family ribonuclease toxin [Terracidiphilus sp.]